jgi:hypothetical protein
VASTPHYFLNAPIKPQEPLTNHEAEYFLQSQASLFWPIRTVAPAYKKGSPHGLATNWSHTIKETTSPALRIGVHPRNSTGHLARNITGLTHSPQHSVLQVNSSSSGSPRHTPLSRYDALGFVQHSTCLAAALVLPRPLQRHRAISSPNAAPTVR